MRAARVEVAERDYQRAMREGLRLEIPFERAPNASALRIEVETEAGARAGSLTIPLKRADGASR